MSELQIELFPINQQIPQWFADYLYKANAGNYGFKQSFYKNVRLIVLRTFGEKAGYDLQIIERKCWICNGTGLYKQYHYENGKRYLRRTWAKTLY